MNFIEQLSEPQFKSFIFVALVEFAEEMAAGAEGIVAESQSGIAEVLLSRGENGGRCSASVILRGQKGKRWMLGR